MTLAIQRSSASGPSRRSPLATRWLPALSLVLLASLATAGTAAAAPSSWDGAATASVAGRGGGGGGAKARGYDISWPQCGGAYPTNPAFGIVGVNRGIVFSENPCLGSQILWADGAAGELYVNTANPGPALSQRWPIGQTTPRVCDPANPDTVDCAYDYGWNAAGHSWQVAVETYAELGLPASPAVTTWWLDVETSNSWREEAFALAYNVAALQGQVDYLESVGVTRLGFYSTTAQWAEITGGTKVFSAYPSWGAGAPSESIAKRHCQSTAGFTGGRLAMVQYPWAGFDADLRC